MGDAPNAFRLTAERKTFLKHLSMYRYLRTTHFYELCEAGHRVSERAVRRLLRDFWRLGFLRRRGAVRGLERDPVSGWENVYWLSPAGVRLARDCGFCAEDFPEGSRTTVRTLEHDAAITDFHLALERFCRGRGCGLHWLQHSLKRGVNPDALFGVTDPDRADDSNTSYFFLEVERSREAGYRDGRSLLLRRLHEYAAYQGSSYCRDDWEWFDEFRVVVVVATEARRRSLLDRLAAELPLPMFWVTVEGADLDGPAFETPADEARYSLLDW